LKPLVASRLGEIDSDQVEANYGAEFLSKDVYKLTGMTACIQPSLFGFLFIHGVTPVSKPQANGGGRYCAAGRFLLPAYASGEGGA
jgi:hypothetical protein